ncbi:kinetochore protein Nuf2-like isoform X1 [Zophobas morio]|uniref:kinetochore protein Nuf2-like isoform X1 n=2 Tax=Zophobas morio TaxID=2755281 RepID=UPI0030839785
MELLQGLLTFGIALSEQSYKNPQREEITEIYFVLVEKVMGIKASDFSQLEFSALESFEFPSLHEESVPKLTLIKALFYLMNICGVQDFILKDLTHPEFQRTRRNLSALINFKKFRATQLIKFQNLQDETDVNENTVREAKSKLYAIQEHLNSQLLQRELAEKQADEVQVEVEGYNKENNVLKEQQVLLQKEILAKENLLGNCADNLANLQFQILEAKNSIADLQKKVVKSPRRVYKEIQDLKKSLLQEKSEIDELEKHGREFLVKQENLGSFQQDLVKTLKALDDLDTTLRQSDSLAERNENLRERIEVSQQELKALSTSQQLLNRLQIHQKEKRSSLRQQHEAKLRELQGKERFFREDKVVLEKKLRQREELFIAHQDKFRDIKGQQDVEMKLLNKEFEFSLNKISNYLQEMDSALR